MSVVTTLLCIHSKIGVLHQHPNFNSQGLIHLPNHLHNQWLCEAPEEDFQPKQHIMLEVNILSYCNVKCILRITEDFFEIWCIELHFEIWEEIQVVEFVAIDCLSHLFVLFTQKSLYSCKKGATPCKIKWVETVMKSRVVNKNWLRWYVSWWLNFNHNTLGEFVIQPH